MGFDIKQKDGLVRQELTGPFFGLNTTNDRNSLPLQYLQSAENVDLSESGFLQTRAGYANILTSDWTNYYIRGGIEYTYGYPETVRTCVFGHTASSSSGVLGYITGGGVSNIKTGLNKDARPSLIAVNDLLFFYNGVDDFLYDGTTTRQIGITAPTNAPTVSATGTGGDLKENGSYYFAYTYYNSTTGAESTPSPLSAAFTATSTGKAAVTVTAGDSATADTIRIYRTTLNGVVLFLDGTIGIASTSFTSTQGDAGLGKELEIDNSRHSTWGYFPYADVVGGRVLLTGDTDIPNRVHCSTISTEGVRPESFPAHCFVDCISSRGRGDKNIGISSANDTPIVLKRYSVGRIDVIGGQSLVKGEGKEDVIFQYRELSREVTAVSHYASTEVLGELIFLGDDNVYATNGEYVRPIADPISKTIRNYAFNIANKFSAIHDRRNKRVIITCSSDQGNSEPDIAIVGRYVGTADSSYPTYTWVVYTGLKWASLFEVPASDTIYAGSTTGDGEIYEINTGTDDDGTEISWKFKTAPINMESSEERKHFKKGYLFAKSSALNQTVNIDTYYDLSDSALEQATVTISNAYLALWDTATFGSSFFSDILPLYVPYHLHHRKYLIELEFSGTGGPVTFYGVIQTALPWNFK